MTPQAKKGILELVILALLFEQPLYGFAIVSQMPKDIGIAEGTIYPLLKRLKDEQLVTTFSQPSLDGPPRKYYLLTELGKQHYFQLRQAWVEFDDAVNRVVRKEGR